jgi:hypothetical protein
MITRHEAEQLAGEIMLAFAADMQRAPNACACCGRAVTWPCAMGAAALEGTQRIVVYPMCEGCAARVQAGSATRRAVELRIRAYIRRAVGAHNPNLSVSIFNT